MILMWCLYNSTLLSYFKALKGWHHITQGAALRYEVVYKSKP